MADKPAQVCNLCGFAFPDLPFWLHNRVGSLEICARCSRAAMRLYSASGQEFALIHKDERERNPEENPFIVTDPQPDVKTIDLYVPKRIKGNQPPSLPVIHQV